MDDLDDLIDPYDDTFDQYDSPYDDDIYDMYDDDRYEDRFEDRYENQYESQLYSKYDDEKEQEESARENAQYGESIEIATEMNEDEYRVIFQEEIDKDAELRQEREEEVNSQPRKKYAVVAEDDFDRYQEEKKLSD